MHSAEVTWEVTWEVIFFYFFTSSGGPGWHLFIPDIGIRIPFLKKNLIIPGCLSTLLCLSKAGLLHIVSAYTNLFWRRNEIDHPVAFRTMP